MSNKAIGEIIRDLRISLGLSQSEFAEKCDISRVSVTRYERGITFPDASIVKKIAVACNVSYDYLMGIDGHDQSNASDDDIKFALFGDVSDITDAQFEEVKRYARYLRERERLDK
jgi:transcriptional regulator with XRE-family HTH domain